MVDAQNRVATRSTLRRARAAAVPRRLVSLPSYLPAAALRVLTVLPCVRIAVVSSRLQLLFAHPLAPPPAPPRRVAWAGLDSAGWSRTAVIMHR